MRYPLLTTVSAAALSFAMFVGAASAQDLGLRQLQDSATSALVKLNMDTSMVDMLTLDELTQVQGVASTTSAPQTKVEQIETILAAAEERIATGGAEVPTGAAGDITPEDLESTLVLEANVGQYLSQLGLASEIDVETLTSDELMQIQLVQSSDAPESEQRTKIETLLAD